MGVKKVSNFLEGTGHITLFSPTDKTLSSILLMDGAKCIWNLANRYGEYAISAYAN